jgi:hypothetical protein
MITPDQAKRLVLILKDFLIANKPQPYDDHQKTLEEVHELPPHTFLVDNHNKATVACMELEYYFNGPDARWANKLEGRTK